MDIKQFDDIRELRKTLDEIEKNSKILSNQLKDCIVLQKRCKKLACKIIKKR